jgi:hypothetical protein
MINLPDHITTGMDDDASSKLGMIAAEISQLQKNGMPANQISAYLQKQMNEVPGMIPFKNAYALYNYLKSHPVAPPAPTPDSAVVGMAKQIAMQDQAKKMAAMPMAAPPMQGAAPPQGPTAPAREGGLADLDAHIIGKHYATGGIVAFDEGGNIQADIDQKKQEEYLNNMMAQRQQAAMQQHQQSLLGMFGLDMNQENNNPILSPDQSFSAAHGGEVRHFDGGDPVTAVQPLSDEEAKQLAGLQRIRSESSGIPSTGRFAGESFTADPNVLQRESIIQQTEPIYQNLLRKKSAYENYVQQQSQAAAAQKFAGQYGVTLPPPTAPAAPTTAPAGGATAPAQLPPGQYTPEELKSFAPFYKPQGIASLRVGAGGGGGAAAQPQPPYPNAEQVYKPDSIETMFDGMMALKKKYGLGAATDAYNQFLNNQQEKIQANADWGKRMELAKFGFGIAATPRPLGQAIGMQGMGLAEGLINVRNNQQAAENNIAKEKFLGAKAIEQEDLGMLRDSVIGHRADSQFAAQQNHNAAMLQMERERTASQERIANQHYGTLAATMKPQQELTALQQAATAAALAGNQKAANFYTDQITKFSGVTPAVLAAGQRADAASIKGWKDANQGLINKWLTTNDPTTESILRRSAPMPLEQLFPNAGVKPSVLNPYSVGP